MMRASTEALIRKFLEATEDPQRHDDGSHDDVKRLLHPDAAILYIVVQRMFESESRRQTERDQTIHKTHHRLSPHRDMNKPVHSSYYSSLVCVLNSSHHGDSFFIIYLFILFFSQRS
jgi:hypothetical protein